MHPPLYQGTVPVPRSAAGTGAPEASSTLTVHLLGSVRETLNHAAVSAWPSGRGRSLF